MATSSPPLRLHLVLALLAALAALGAALSAPPAQARVIVGIGQQTPEIFRSPHWAELQAPNVRYITPWDVIDDPLQLEKLDIWMTAANGVGAEVMIGFQKSLKSARSGKVLPSPRRYARAFRAIRERYPNVRNWVPWNETNHATALTGDRPRRAAQYFNIVTRQCPKCNVVAGDVLDLPNMESWIKRFQRHTKTRPKIWGLHNYHDANAKLSDSTKKLLRITSGQIWFTETGGLVKRRLNERGGMKTRTYGTRSAARATRHVLNLSRISKRIRRIYLYHWLAPSRFTTWDSALTDHKMRPRRSYHVLDRWLTKARRSGLAAPAGR
jgi:hypothetical protein